MKTKTKEEYDEIVKDAVVLVRENFGNKVLITPNGNIVKAFHHRKRIGSHLTYSHIGHFLKNAFRLKIKNINTLNPIEWFRVKELKRDVVIYPEIPGKSVRDYLASGDVSILGKLARFLACIHKKNVYFRAGHLGNFLIRNDNELALIDVCNVKFRLDTRRRAKSVAYLFFHDRTDHQAFKRYGFDKFIEEYLRYADLNKIGEKCFKADINHRVKKYFKKHPDESMTYL